MTESGHSHIFVDSNKTQIWKVFKTTKETPFPRMDALSEIDFLENLKHPNLPEAINKIIYIDKGVKHFAMSMPYYGIPLSRDMILGFSEQEKIRVLTQYFSALEYIHSLDILHCDIKMDNVLVNQSKHCELKLIDFGLSLILHTPRQYVYTGQMYVPDHKPPEFEGRQIIEPELSMDIYASGKMFAFLGLICQDTNLIAFNPDDRPSASDVLLMLNESRWEDVLHHE